MEANGAVFLPASGRFGMDVEKAGSHGYYWSSSAFDDYAADYLHLYGGDVSLVSGGSRNYGRSVRLVQNVK